MIQTAGICGIMETLFYLPNHLRQTILVNSNHVSFVSKDAALLDLMNVMFKINRGVNAPIQEFRLSNFFACYRPFVLQTLPYECLSLGLRLSLFEHLYQSCKDIPVGGTILAGSIAGAIS